MDVYSSFNEILESLKNNIGYDDKVFDEFILEFENEYKKCKGNLTKKYSAFLENNDFLHDSEIIEVSVKSYLSNQKFLNDVAIQIRTSCTKEVHTIIFKQVSKFAIERYEESNSRWKWGYGYLKKISDNYIEQSIICYPCTLIKVNFKKVIVK